jgi:hypothetical protein
MLYYILEERKNVPKHIFSSMEEDVYEEHFLPYGVTPRQYEKLLSIVQIIEYKKGDVIIETGSFFNDVYLVTNGSTFGVTNKSKRKVIAASSQKGNKDLLTGGDAGAWIGELSFLELFNRKMMKKTTTVTNTVATTEESLGRESQKLVSRPTVKKYNISIGKNTTIPGPIPISTANSSSSTGNDSSSEHVKTLATASISSNDKQIQQQQHQHHQQQLPLSEIKHDQQPPRQTQNQLGQALLTYVANEDKTTIYKWNFEELINLLQNSSPELRQAVTRAMTAAVVNKVVNLYVSNHEHEECKNEKYEDEEREYEYVNANVNVNEDEEREEVETLKEHNENRHSNPVSASVSASASQHVQVQVPLHLNLRSHSPLPSHLALDTSWWKKWIKGTHNDVHANVRESKSQENKNARANANEENNDNNISNTSSARSCSERSKVLA